MIKPWITKRLQELLGIEDDVVIEFVFNQLEEKVGIRLHAHCIIYVCFPTRIPIQK